ncbi:MAG: toll/interleukin-1 receptor domain-containing protein, partial [Bryobacteraceae bacterium]|nr:toll/interleukin-1 receptor domain-containing protein [Bryobacteraceae bacterium]
MKVFLSHSTKDGEFVGKLAAALTADGFTPWLCEVDVDYAESFMHKINEGLAEAGFVLLIWSPEAAGSQWTRLEWEAALHREVAESVTH